RKGLVELQEWFYRMHFEASSRRSAWKVTCNENIAPRLPGHTRRATVREPRKPTDSLMWQTTQDWPHERPPRCLAKKCRRSAATPIIHCHRRNCSHIRDKLGRKRPLSRIWWTHCTLSHYVEA
ncbi:hypothetical protein, partial [Salmonella enterica]|uniref:hypothetical protein n=1 Tax=Salmonella enterica TaxID=28901 RepID=UPI00398C7E3E